MNAVAQLPPGALFARDFRVVRPLAEGGMGAVYVVDQLSTSERRALKVMHPQFVTDVRSRQRFDQEARVGAQIRSNHVVKVIQAGIDEPTGMPWLCMELLEGEDLEAAAARAGRLPPDAVAAIFEQMCHALEQAHRAAIVHRDLKPENIFLAAPLSPGVPFTVKLLDFGIAKLVQEARATHGATAAVGTPLWMAPEQAQAGTDIAPGTDVWALGLIAFRLLTGRCYWKSANLDGATVMMVYGEVLTGELPPASQRAWELGPPAATALPPGFDAWFSRCVTRRMSERFAHAGEARDALLAVLRGDAPRPLPSSTLAAPGVTPYSVPPPMPTLAAPLSAPPGVTPYPVASTAFVSGPGMYAPSGPVAPTPRRGPPVAALVALGALGVALAGGVAVVAVRQGAPSAAPSPSPAPAVPTSAAPAASPIPAPAPAAQGPVRADTRIVYGASPERHLANCLFCDATFMGGRGGALLRFQQGGGYTVWSLNLPPTLAAGTHRVGNLQSRVHVYVAESDATLPARVRGSYFSASGTLEVTSIDYRHGGHIDGTLDVVLQGGNAQPPVRATLRATFHAEFPN